MSRNHLDNNCNDDKINHSCEKSVCKSFDISLPITITTFAVPSKPKVKCSREIEITNGHKCCRRKDNSFKFTITQKINVDIPVKFGAEVCYDEAYSFDNGICDRPGA